MRRHQIRLRVRPGDTYISRNRTILATDATGSIRPDSNDGLFVSETRLLSRFEHWINGQRPSPVITSTITQDSWMGYFLVKPRHAEIPTGSGSGNVQLESEESLELRISRRVGYGMREEIECSNFSQSDQPVDLEIDIDADFRDLTLIAGQRHDGKTTRRWTQSKSGIADLRFEHLASRYYAHQGHSGLATFQCGAVARIECADTAPSLSGTHIRFQFQIPPRGRWTATIDVRPISPNESAPASDSVGRVLDDWGQRRENFLSTAASFSADAGRRLDRVLIEALDQAADDLIALRLYDLDTTRNAWTVAAGIPLYIALFGRDTLVAGRQAMLLGPEILSGSLFQLGARQGKRIDDWRDEQPGRIVHEEHSGALEILQYNPLGRDYSSLTSSTLYPAALGDLWRWTGDKHTVEKLLPVAMDALRWCERYADLDRDGFYEYKTRSRQGVKNQGWKDSGDAIVDGDGRQVDPPIATCEEQGNVYDSKLQLSELLWWLGRKDEAVALFQDAEELKKRFNETFWMDQEGFFAIGMDSRKQLIRSISSNPGHLLLSGIAEAELGRRVARRLMKEDMFSGWGIRTLSSANPAYDPYSYHRGSVWPTENGAFAMGFRKYGIPEHCHQLSRALLECASLFDYCRLPEVFSGHSRDEQHPFPALYPQANAPQAWSSSVVFAILQAILGLAPYAPLNLLLLDPHLPEWLPEITINRLRVGSAQASIRIFRSGDGTSGFEILDLQGSLNVVRQKYPWISAIPWVEDRVDALTGTHSR